MNGKLTIVGIVVVVIAVVGFLAFSAVMTPAQVKVLAAASEIPSGSSLAKFPLTAFTQVTSNSKSTVTDALVTADEYTAMLAAGGSFARTIHAGEPILKTDIISSANPSASNDTTLALSDPKMIVMHLKAKDAVSDSVSVGDRVDISVAVDTVDLNYDFESSVAGDVAKAKQFAEAQKTDPSLRLNPDGTIPDSFIWTNPSNADMAKYGINAPFAITAVHNAKVVNVTREQNSSYNMSSSSAGSTDSSVTQTVTDGAITSIDVMIPRDSFDLLSMANAAGALNMALVSPLADNVAPTSIGATLNDLILMYYSDRGMVDPKGNIQPAYVTPTPTPASK